jgi:hypothetical protein
VNETDHTMTTEAQESPRFLLILIAVFIAITIAVTLVLRGPEPQPLTADASRFSASRAHAELSFVMQADRSRAVGTQEHDEARTRILSRLGSFGYVMTAGSEYICDGAVTCSDIQNILAQRPEDVGRGPGVLVVAHYDSVPTGPGASDDGDGVAVILEMARALRNERSTRPVRFLLTDGEELGLMGARAFVKHPANVALADVVVNLENRGTSGPSFMFETSRNNSELIRVFRSSVARPVSTSLFVNIYELLPNDTDLTVFKRAGIQGYNFAAIRDPWAYHTPFDGLQRIDRRTLQQHGDNTLALTRALARQKLEKASGNAVHFDVLSLGVIAWPAAWSLPAALALLLGSIVIVLLRRKGIGRSLFNVPLTIVAVALAGFLLTALGTLRSSDVRWIATPGPISLALWLAGASLPVILASWFRRHATGAGMVATTALWWNVLGVACAFALTGGSYLFIVPGVALLAAALLLGNRPRAGRIAAAVAMSIAAILWLPFATVLYEALASPALPAIALIVAFIVMTVAPLVATQTRRAVRAALGAACVIALAASTLPAATAHRPRPANLILYCEERQPARWFATSAPPYLKVAGSFDSRLRTMLPWAPYARGFAADASEFIVPAPVADVTTTKRGTTHLTRFSLRSARNATRVTVAFRSQRPPTAIRANGMEAVAASSDIDWKRVTVYGDGATIEIETDAPLLEAWCYDVTYGLPDGAGHLNGARTRDAAVPIQDGDIIVASRRVIPPQ